MKKIFIIFSIFLSINISLSAGKIVTDSVRSEILSSVVKYNIYLPSGYDETKQYPVVYLLHGLGDIYDAWQTKGSMKTVADELILSGESKPMLIVMPNAGGGQNDWKGYFNMPGWNYEEFFFNELIPNVESKYHGIGDRGHRAIMGLSMGGGGSVVYCQHHPEVFSCCYAMSPWLDNQDHVVGGNVPEKSKMYYLSEAICENAPVKFLNEANPETLREMRTIRWFIDCGDDDFLLEQTFDFYLTTRKFKINTQLRVRNGEHSWEYWHASLRTALSFASVNFR